MCIARVGAAPFLFAADPDEGGGRLADVFATTMADHTLDGIFELNVLRPITSQEFDDMEQQMRDIDHTQSRLGLPILLHSTTRQNIHMPSDVFWSAVLSPGQAVSTFYQRACMQDRSGCFAVEPATGVVGQCVILCIELRFNISKVVVYRDILTDLQTTLRDALCNFNSVLGFAPETRYTFLVHDEDLGWQAVGFSDVMLAMSMRHVLLHPSVRECYAVDYFRLSPTNVEEIASGGVLVCSQA